MEKFIIKVAFALLCIGILPTTGIVLMEPELCFGQTQKKTIVFHEGRKDPFSIPPGVRLLSKEMPVKEEKTVQPIVGVKTNEIKPVEPTLHLKAVLISDRIRLASIDRSIVTVGDSIGGEKVLEIWSDRVIFEKEGKKRTILLDQSPVKLTVEGR